MTSCRSLGAPRRRLTRGLRWLGLDRNPLRRTVDRIETAIRLGVLVLIFTAVPAAAMLTGRWAYHAALAQTRAQDATTHTVSGLAALALLLGPGCSATGCCNGGG